MPDSLLTMTEALNGVPDNTSNLVTPQNVRQALLSIVADHGVAAADQATLPQTIPITQNVYADIPAALIAEGATMISGTLPLYWRMDANGHLYYDYPADWPGVTVPAGYLRSVGITALIDVELASATNVYAFTITLDGVPVGNTIYVDEAQNQDRTLVALETQQALEVGAAPIVSVAVTNTAGGSDLDVLSFGYRCIGGPPA